MPYIQCNAKVCQWKKEITIFFFEREKVSNEKEKIFFKCYCVQLKITYRSINIAQHSR